MWVGSAVYSLCFLSVFAQDSVWAVKPKLYSRVSAENRIEYVFPTNNFLKGNNNKNKPINKATSLHFDFSFQYAPNSCVGRVYGESYQGVGVGMYDFSNVSEMGSPRAFYVFQGARIARFAPWAALRYEWNFGLSWKWEPYDVETNSFNGGVGTRRNAYINAGLFVDWRLSRRLDVITGVSFSHFSNGNTKYPNAGVNNGGARIGIAYYFNRPALNASTEQTELSVPPFPRHVSYDLLIFGSLRRKGVDVDGKLLAMPGQFGVVGFSFAPLYNFSYKFRAGLSLDGVYDESANVYSRETISDLYDDNYGYVFYKPPLKQQFTLVISAKIEYAMPFFTIGIGIGHNMLYAYGEKRGFYQTLALKINVTRSAYLNVGYNLQDFRSPNFLMLGIGYRFNNRYPRMKWL